MRPDPPDQRARPAPTLEEHQAPRCRDQSSAPGVDDASEGEGAATAPAAPSPPEAARHRARRHGNQAASTAPVAPVVQATAPASTPPYRHAIPASTRRQDVLWPPRSRTGGSHRTQPPHPLAAAPPRPWVGVPSTDAVGAVASREPPPRRAWPPPAPAHRTRWHRGRAPPQPKAEGPHSCGRACRSLHDAPTAVWRAGPARRPDRSQSGRAWGAASMCAPNPAGVLKSTWRGGAGGCRSLPPPWAVWSATSLVLTL